MITAKRSGDVDHPPFRSQRLISENGQWYFDTREGTQVGPYPDIREVKKALAASIARWLLASHDPDAGHEAYLPGSQDGIEDMVAEIHHYFLEYQSKGQTAATLWANQRRRELLQSRDSRSMRTSRLEAIEYALELELQS